MWFYRLTVFFKFLGGFCVSLVVVAGVFLFNFSAFPNEKKTEYYLYSSSSQAKIVREISLNDLLFLKGERAETTETEVGVLLERYGASVVFLEEFADGVSYYCYSPTLKTPLLIDGKFINLQIVVKKSGVLLGSPVVFGGY